MSSPHVPVMLKEVLAAIEPAPGKTIIDGTFGAGGYSAAFLAAGARVLAFDRDPSAARFASAMQPKDRFRLVGDCFSAMEAHIQTVDGVALDLGVSSMQLDEDARGFSFMRDGPLDMRMGADGPTAADLVNHETQEALARILFVYGEERQSRRIASAIVRRRVETPFSRTLDLAEVVERALGGRRGMKTHPATRTFQALRIAVNEELDELEAGLAAAERVLVEGGVLAVVTFHSLEDRIVKAFFTERAGRLPSGSRHLPPKIVEKSATFSMKYVRSRPPSEAEVEANPRARSAKLRAGVRTGAAAWEAAA